MELPIRARYILVLYILLYFICIYVVLFCPLLWCYVCIVLLYACCSLSENDEIKLINQSIIHKEGPRTKTIHVFHIPQGTDICTFLLKRYILVYGTGALWDLLGWPLGHVMLAACGISLAGVLADWFCVSCLPWTIPSLTRCCLRSLF